MLCCSLPTPRNKNARLTTSPPHALVALLSLEKYRRPLVTCERQAKEEYPPQPPRAEAWIGFLQYRPNYHSQTLLLYWNTVARFPFPCVPRRISSRFRKSNSSEIGFISLGELEGSNTWRRISYVTTSLRVGRRMST